MKKPDITKKQKEILLYLLKFRFLTTHHIQTLLEHKNPNRTLSWLKDLIEKDCVKRHYDRTSLADSTKPAVYYLGPKSRHILADEKDLELDDLEYIYQEKRREKKFIFRCLFLADVYFYLLSRKDPKEELKFFTKTDLSGYEYFPDPLPDAFIAVKGGKITRRYFLYFFDTYTPPFVYRQRVRMYLDYAEKSEWDENTNSAPLPSVLFICPNQRAKNHVNYYAKALLEKTYDDKIALFLTTMNKIKYRTDENIWEKVSVTDEV